MSKKKIGVLGLVIVICIMLSGCVSDGIEQFVIDKNNLNITINSYGGGKAFKIFCSGNNNIITVNETVNLVDLKLWGNGSVVYISRTHNCTIVDDKKKNQVIFYD